MEISKIITAEEFLNRGLNDSGFELSGEQLKIIARNAKDFAKLHVKAALEAAHSNMQLPEEDLEFTLSSYPENLIK